MPHHSEEMTELHDQWKDCTRCKLACPSSKHVLWEEFHPRKSKRVDLIIIGEGPGMVENVTGIPFTGPSGKLLRECLINAGIYPNYSMILTNLVACRPYAKAPTLPMNRAPEDDEVKACAGRVLGLMFLWNPRIVLTVGKVPELYTDYFDKRLGYESVFRNVAHPAYVIRLPDQDKARQDYVQSLSLIRKELER